MEYSPLPPSPSSSQSTASPSKVEVKKAKILIVDDDPDITNSFSLCLEDSGLFEVDSYNDSVEALSNFKANSYNLMLLDIKMPKLNGFQLRDTMKEIDEKVKVCFISAYDINSAELKDLVPPAGVECFIPKPIQVKELIIRIETELLR
jgi:DNA-binding response OmpR family regulator